MQKLFVILILVLISLASSSSSYALSCVPPNPNDILTPRENLQANKYVFAGVVTNIDKGTLNTGGSNEHEITITKWVKGETDKPVQVLSDATWGGVFEEGFNGLFLFDAPITEEHREYDKDQLQFSTALCGDGNPEVVALDSPEYAELIDDIKESREETEDDDLPVQTVLLIGAATGALFGAVAYAVFSLTKRRKSR